jgi:hypothetical protein
MRILLAALALGLVLSAPRTALAQAGSAPDFDPAAYCQQLGERLGQVFRLQGCIDQEEESLVEIRAMRALDAEVVSQCTAFAASAGGSYVLYQGCLRQGAARPSSRP